VQIAVLRLHDVHPSVCLPVTLVHGSGTHWLEILETSLIAPLFSAAQYHPPTHRTWWNFGETTGDGKGGMLEHKSDNISWND